VLDKWAGKPISNTRRSQRNAAAHGGSILADYDVILREVDQPASRVDRWKPAFESHYNVSWEFQDGERRREGKRFPTSHFLYLTISRD
jgi:hypothetical protein